MALPFPQDKYLDYLSDPSGHIVYEKLVQKMDKDTDPRMLGPGGAPTRATTLPTDAKARKNCPVGTGVLDYFPDAIVAVSEISYAGNEQHNPGQSLRWTRDKSSDEADTLIRHFLQRGLRDTDGKRHSAKMAWRALALLQKEIEAEQEKAKAEQKGDGRAIYGGKLC